MFHGATIHYKPKVSKDNLESFRKIHKIITGRTSLEDSTIFKVFERNKNWSSMTIVNDLTASMYDYAAQVIYWYKVNKDKDKINRFIFFNDGDRKPDESKEINRTGGIYSVATDNPQKLLKTMREVILYGDGGDNPENDIEAILYAIDNAMSDDIILIADNRSEIRDIEIADLVTKPIRIILCGRDKNKKIHPHYLQLARITGGSVHTIEKDISYLDIFEEGDVFKLFDVSYKVKGNSIIESLNDHE